MENAEDCIVCTSGMAACTLVYLTYLSAGDHVILFHDIYGAHYKVSLILERMGINITWLDADDSAGVKAHIRPETKMILLETPSNPLCKVVDIAGIRKAAGREDILVCVDNTFATPYHTRPLELGADLVIHSATKGLGGHNDLMAGAIATSKEHYNNLWFTRQAIGTTLDAYSASLLERGLKTFELRAEKWPATPRPSPNTSRTPQDLPPVLSGLPSHPVRNRRAPDAPRFRRHDVVRRRARPGRRQIHLLAQAHLSRRELGSTGR